MANAIITDDFRKNQLELMIADITKAKDATDTGYFIGIGKSDPWNNRINSVLTDTAPVPNGSDLEKQDVIDNLLTLALIETDAICKLAVKTNQEWEAGVKFKVYDPTDLTCFDTDLTSGIKGCYAWYGAGETKSVFLCLGNGGNNVPGGITELDNSAEITQNPPASTTVGVPVDNGAPGSTTDAYIWVKLGEFSPTSEFIESQTFFELPVVLSDSAEIDAANNASAGLLHGFKIEDPGNAYPTTGLVSAELRITDLAGNSKKVDVKAFINDQGQVTSIEPSASTEASRTKFTLTQMSQESSNGAGLTTGIRRASVHVTGGGVPTGESGKTAKIRPLFGLTKGYGVEENTGSGLLDLFPPFYLGLTFDFVQNVTGDAFTDITFRQVSIIKNPLRAGGTGDTTTGTDTPGDTKDTSVQTLDSLKSIGFTGTAPTLSAGQTTEGWYMVRTSNGERAWIDKIDDTNDLIYFHQNSASRKVGTSAPTIAGSTLDQWSDINDGFKVYNNNNQEVGSSLTQSSLNQAEHIENTGTVLFLENRSGIKRTSAQTEKVRIILQF